MGDMNIESSPKGVSGIQEAPTREATQASMAKALDSAQNSAATGPKVNTPKSSDSSGPSAFERFKNVFANILPAGISFSSIIGKISSALRSSVNSSVNVEKKEPPTTQKEYSIGTTKEVLKETIGNALSTDEGLSYQVQRDIIGMQNISKDDSGNEDFGKIYIGGKMFQFEQLTQADTSKPWQTFVPDALKEMLPDESSQRMAMVLLTQGASAETVKLSSGLPEATQGTHFYSGSGQENRFYTENGSAFLEKEVLFQGKNLDTAKVDNHVTYTMKVNLSDPNAAVTYTELRK